MKSQLGRLEAVELRELWRDEARDFTPWLADEGLILIGEVIGATLVLVEQEKNVGPFSADILARIEDYDDQLVVIENQLEKTDHDHLGKIITYASGLEAQTVVWVAREFTEEHRQALDWLNTTTGTDTSFFGLEIQLWRIGDSDPAPQFRIVSSPNNWTKTVRVTKKGKLTRTELEYQEFWQELADHMHTNGTNLSITKAHPQHWYYFSLGRSNFIISLTLNSKANRVGCEIYITGDQAKQAFDLLSSQKEAIESETKCRLDWQRLDGRIASRIALYRDGSIADPAQREEAKKWMHQTAEQFHRAFSRRVKALDLDAKAEATA